MTYPRYVLLVFVFSLLTPIRAYSLLPFLSWRQLDNCDDVAIIGAGVGGSYASWRLKDRGLKIRLYEYSNRIGGRFYSVEDPKVPGVAIDLGGMRFIPENHPIMNSTIHTLGLEVKDFGGGFGQTPSTLYSFRGTHMKSDELSSSKNPYNLQPWELASKELFIDILEKLTGVREVTKENIFNLKTYDGVKLNEISLVTALKKVASNEAIRYLRDQNGFWGEYESETSGVWSYQEWFSYTDEYHVKTVKGGMDTIPKRLVREFLNASETHNYSPNRQLLEIAKKFPFGYELTFRKTTTKDDVTTPVPGNVGLVKTCAKKVIISVSHMALERIDWPVLTQNPTIKEYMGSVLTPPTSKVFLAYDKAWWNVVPNNPTHVRSDEQARMTYYFGRSEVNNNSILLTSYVDSDSVWVFREMNSHGESIDGSLPGANRVSKILKNELQKQMAYIYGLNISDIPEPISGAAKFWDKYEYPFGYGWTLWRPGYDWNVIGNAMLRPSSLDDVYIVGSTFAYGDLQSWAEGALETVDNMLKTYFNTPKKKTPSLLNFWANK